jgi:hypothetical protein
VKSSASTSPPLPIGRDLSIVLDGEPARELLSPRPDGIRALVQMAGNVAGAEYGGRQILHERRLIDRRALRIPEPIQRDKGADIV